VRKPENVKVFGDLRHEMFVLAYVARLKQKSVHGQGVC
jgi:hypothetical protein